jgi:hypothetical protein
MTARLIELLRRGPAVAVFALLTALASMLAAPATAQPAPVAPPPDCSKVAPEMRAGCEDALKATRACAGLSGEALRDCQRKNSDVASVREDCTKVAAADRAACDARNRRADIAARCGGKVGDELRRCAEAPAPAR